MTPGKPKLPEILWCSQLSSSLMNWGMIGRQSKPNNFDFVEPNCGLLEFMWYPKTVSCTGNTQPHRIWGHQLHPYDCKVTQNTFNLTIKIPKERYLTDIQTDSTCLHFAMHFGKSRWNNYKVMRPHHIAMDTQETQNPLRITQPLTLSKTLKQRSWQRHVSHVQFTYQ